MTNRDAPEFVGPAGEFPFEAVQRQIAVRRALLADEMKKRQRVPNMPEGSMVGNRYVAPHFLAQLAAASGPMLDRMGMQMLNQQDQNQSAELASRDAAAAAKHIAARPGYATSGEDREGNAIVSNIAPTSNDITSWASKGLNIPSRKEMLTRLIQDQEINEPVRQEARQEKRLNREDVQAASREAAAALAQARKDQLASGEVLAREKLAEQAKEAARRSEDTREKLAEQAKEAARRSEDTRLGIEQRRDAANQHNALMKLLQGNKPIPNAVHKELSATEEAASNINSLRDNFKPEFAGLTQPLSNFVAEYNPFGVSSEGVQFWKDYRKRSSLEEAHKIFGASFTAGEQKRWNEADIAPSMNAATIQANLAKRADIANRMHANAVNRYKVGGYPEIEKVFPVNALRATTTPVAPLTRKDVITKAMSAANDYGITVVSTGILNGRRVEKLSNGEVRYAN